MQERLAVPLLVAALLTIPAIAIEQSDVGQPWDTIANVLNWVIWTAFLGEAILMLRVVDDRWRWVREHPLEVAIVILTPPFLPPSMQAARVFRLLRLLRLLRLALPSIGPGPADAFNRLDYLVRQLTDEPDARLVEGPSQQNVTQFLPGGQTTEVAGSRFVKETDATSEAPALTSVGLTTTTSERDVTMFCQVPTRLHPSYRGACNQFLSTLTLTR